MKFLAAILVAASVVQAHYTFPRLVVNGVAEASDWSVTRRTKNADSKQGIEVPTNSDIRCYSSQNAPSIATVPAGARVHYISTQQVNHPGPTQYYIAKVPSGQSALTWDGSGAVWSRLSTTKPTVDANRQMTWPGQNEYRLVEVTIPSTLAPGEYLLRVEHIALHMASRPNAAQFYLACSQIRVTGSGSGVPGPLVSLPGAYQSNDPGILVNLYTMAPDSYVGPGPAIWTG
ncbi:hypothetical protein S40293_03996 [Stachybotrys chartarum IBT 40293]|nr:hypothetical protein S40293_03996 [Stachybotrys chartarum IBT 40293]